jgi:GxxExxY protein
MNHETNYPHKELTGKIIAAAFDVHSNLGCGFLESVYHEAMKVELNANGIDFQSQCPVSVSYKGVKLKNYLIDLVVNEQVIVELKATKFIESIFEAQLLNYLKATGYKIGLLINFGASSLQYKRLIY